MSRDLLFVRLGDRSRALSRRDLVAIEKIGTRNASPAIRTDLKNTYASKDELMEVRQDVVELKGHIGWIVKLAVGLIVTAIIGPVIVNGGSVR